jgi:hypothetical protein
MAALSRRWCRSAVVAVVRREQREWRCSVSWSGLPAREMKMMTINNCKFSIDFFSRRRAALRSIILRRKNFIKLCPIKSGKHIFVQIKDE